MENIEKITLDSKTDELGSLVIDVLGAHLKHDSALLDTVFLVGNIGKLVEGHVFLTNETIREHLNNGSAIQIGERVYNSNYFEILGVTKEATNEEINLVAKAKIAEEFANLTEEQRMTIDQAFSAEEIARINKLLNIKQNLPVVVTKEVFLVKTIEEAPVKSKNAKKWLKGLGLAALVGLVLFGLSKLGLNNKNQFDKAEAIDKTSTETTSERGINDLFKLIDSSKYPVMITDFNTGEHRKLTIEDLELLAKFTEITNHNEADLDHVLQMLGQLSNYVEVNGEIHHLDFSLLFTDNSEIKDELETIEETTDALLADLNNEEKVEDFYDMMYDTVRGEGDIFNVIEYANNEPSAVVNASLISALNTVTMNNTDTANKNDELVKTFATYVEEDNANILKRK